MVERHARDGMRWVDNVSEHVAVKKPSLVVTVMGAVPAPHAVTRPFVPTAVMAGMSDDQEQVLSDAFARRK